MTDRRSFLARFGASLGATALGAAGLGRFAAACAPNASDVPESTDATSTTTSAARAPATKAIGVQLYTVRQAMERDMEGTLARVAGIGYTEVEFAGYFGRTPAEVRQMLARHRLAAPSAHVPLEMLESSVSAVTDAARTIGHQFLVVPWLAVERRRTIDDYRAVARQLNRFGETVRNAGMRLGYHNHDFEFMPIGGQVPYETLVRETDPELVTMELDLYWAVKAGHQPTDLFSRYPGRFTMVHVKDSAGAPEHRMTDVGAGTLDFATMLRAGRAAGVRHMFVEHDQPADPFASISAGYAHLARLPD